MATNKSIFALLSLIVLIGIFYGALRRDRGSHEKEWRLVSCEAKKDKNAQKDDAASMFDGAMFSFSGPTRIYASDNYSGCDLPIGTKFFRQNGYLCHKELRWDNLSGQIDRCLQIVAESGNL